MTPVTKIIQQLPRPSVLILGHLQMAKLEQLYKPLLPQNRNEPFVINGITIIPSALTDYAAYVRNSDYHKLD